MEEIFICFGVTFNVLVKCLNALLLAWLTPIAFTENENVWKPFDSATMKNFMMKTFRIRRSGRFPDLISPLYAY